MIAALLAIAAVGAVLAAAAAVTERAGSAARARQEGGQLALALVLADTCARAGQAPASCLPASFSATGANRSRVAVGAVAAPHWPGAARRGVAWTVGGSDLRAGRGGETNEAARKQGVARVWIEGQSAADAGHAEARAAVAAARTAAGDPALQDGEFFATWREIAASPAAFLRNTDAEDGLPLAAATLDLGGNDVLGAGSRVEAAEGDATADGTAASLEAGLVRFAGLARFLSAGTSLSATGEARAGGVSATTVTGNGSIGVDNAEARTGTLSGNMEVLLCTGC